VREANGRFLSRDDANARSKEEVERATDRQAARAKYSKQQQQRGFEVAMAHAQRQQRSQTKAGALKPAYKTKKQGKPQYAKPSKTTFFGKYRVRLYKFRNVRGLQVASEFVKRAAKLTPKAVGRIAIGTGYGKAADWVGSRTEKLSRLWRWTQSVGMSPSDKLVFGEKGDKPRAVWTEVEIIDTVKESRNGAAKQGRTGKARKR
jgi:hypothetical protein